MTEKGKRLFRMMVLATLGVLLVFLSINVLATLGTIILFLTYALRAVFNPVLVGFLLAYVLSPLVDWMEKAGMHRAFAIGAVYVVIALALTGGVMYGGPIIVGEIGALVEAFIGREYVEAAPEGRREPAAITGVREGARGAEDSPRGAEGFDSLWAIDPTFPPQQPALPGTDPAVDPEDTPDGPPQDIVPTPPVERRYEPGYLERMRLWARDLVRNWNKKFADRPELQISLDAPRIREVLRDSIQGLRDAGATIYNTIRTNLLALLAFLAFAVLVPIYTFFFLLELHNMRHAVVAHMPPGWREKTDRILDETHQAISSFFHGRVIIGSIDAVLICTALYISGTRFWLIMGLIAGLLGIVPIAGPALAFVPIFVLSIVDHGLATTLVVALAFWGIQSFDGFVLTPLILGAKVRLHPLTLMIALLAGGHLFGAFGVLAAVPVVSILKILGKEFVMPHLRSMAKDGDAPDTEGQEAPCESP